MKKLITWLYAKYVLVPMLKKMDPETKLEDGMIDALMNVEYTATEVEWVIDNRSVH